MNALWTLIIVAAVFTGLIYFMMVRPIRQREKMHDQMVQELRPGDTVITAGGIYGVVDTIDDNSVVLKIESGLMRVTKGGVIRRDDI